MFVHFIRLKFKFICICDCISPSVFLLHLQLVSNFWVDICCEFDVLLTFLWIQVFVEFVSNQPTVNEAFVVVSCPSFAFNLKAIMLIIALCWLLGRNRGANWSTGSSRSPADRFLHSCHGFIGPCDAAHSDSTVCDRICGRPWCSSNACGGRGAGRQTETTTPRWLIEDKTNGFERRRGNIRMCE